MTKTSGLFDPFIKYDIPLVHSWFRNNLSDYQGIPRENVLKDILPLIKEK